MNKLPQLAHVITKWPQGSGRVEPWRLSRKTNNENLSVKRGRGAGETSRISACSDRLEAQQTLRALWRARQMTFENPGDSWKKDSRKQYAGGLGGGRIAKMQVIYEVWASSKPYGGPLWSKEDCPYPETCARVWKCIQRLHYKTVRVVMLMKWSSLTSTWLLVSSVLQRRGGWSSGKQCILFMEVQLWCEENQTFLKKSLFAKDSTGVSAQGVHNRKRRPEVLKVMCANGLKTVWKGRRDWFPGKAGPVSEQK